MIAGRFTRPADIGRNPQDPKISRIWTGSEAGAALYRLRIAAASARALLYLYATTVLPGEPTMTPRSAAFVAVSLGIALASHVPAARADALADIMKAKVIKIAVPQDFAPFGSAGPDLKPQGYDIDMANLIGKALGVKVDIIPVSSANRIPYLQTKKADLVISSLGKNAEREKVIDFSLAYAPFFSGVYGTK